MPSNSTASINKSQSRRSTGKKKTEGSTSTKNTSPYDRAFQQNLVDHNVFPPGYVFPDGRIPPKPRNWEYIESRLKEPRRSLSPSKFSDEQHAKFVQANSDAVKEQQVQTNVLPLVQGEIKVPKTSSGKIPFRNLAPLTGENLISGNPDLYHGARPEELKRMIRDEHGQLVIPSTQHDLPIMPNHFTAARGPDGTLAVALRQATYDAAFGTRAIHTVQSFGQQVPQYDDNAYTFTCIYVYGQLMIFTSHFEPPENPEARPNNFTHQLRCFSMIDKTKTWRKGATYYRNSIGLAKEWRDIAIRQANEVADRPLSAPFSATNVDSTSFISTSEIEISLEDTFSQEIIYSQQQDTYTTETQVESPRSPTSDDFHTAEEEEPPSQPLPVKRLNKSRGGRGSRKRQNHADAGDAGTPPLRSGRTATP